MYAVIKTGGKQYRVSKDDVVTIERVSGEAGAKVEFDQVLMVAAKIRAARRATVRTFRLCALPTSPARNEPPLYLRI